jgi:hypothetical protein
MHSPLAAYAKDRITGYPQQQDWESTLTSGQYYILRQGGTEPPNSSPLVKEKRAGTFVCAGCGTPLFASDQKFDSGIIPPYLPTTYYHPTLDRGRFNFSRPRHGRQCSRSNYG